MLRTICLSSILILALIAMIGLVVGIAPSFLDTTNRHGVISRVTWQPLAVRPALADGTFTVFLPAVFRNHPPPLPVFGIEVSAVTENGGLGRLVESQTYWVRAAASRVRWDSVEPNEGERRWEVLSGIEQQWQNASSRGLVTVVVISGTPPWAQKIPGYSCGPIKPDKLEAFANFMYDLVARYHAAPYNIKYWEIWNEPDIDPYIGYSPDSPIGCWGDYGDAYYGGGYYAEMLKYVYPKVKVADPQAQVIVGGLLLHCNPDISGACDSGIHKDKPPRFLEGILRHNGQNDGGQYFDGVSFHAYDWYIGQLGQYWSGTWQSSWNTTGPVLIAKVEFIRSVLRKYGASGKFLMNTETALCCTWQGCNNEIFERSKAYYVVQSYAAAIAEGIMSNIWYSLHGWPTRHTELIDSYGNALPAYKTYKFAVSELRSVRFVRKITEYTSIIGYEFDRGDRRLWIIWSSDGSPHVIRLPRFPSAIYDSDGDALAVSDSPTVTIEPLYLEW